MRHLNWRPALIAAAIVSLLAPAMAGGQSHPGGNHVLTDQRSRIPERAAESRR